MKVRILPEAEADLAPQLPVNRSESHLAVV
jgi:hypothetical protein